MRANIPEYDLRVPGSLSEALALLAQEPGVWQPFAGGTDLMVLLQAGKLDHRRFLSIWRLPELRGDSVMSTLGASRRSLVSIDAHADFTRSNRPR